MKVDELTIEVKAGINIDRKTAETCLKLVELYVNNTGNVIVAHREENGTLTFSFIEEAENNVLQHD